MKRLLILTIAIYALLLSACTVSQNNANASEEISSTESTGADTSVSAETESASQIIGYTPDGNPIYDGQDYVPEPYYFDEFGVKYTLKEGTIDEYYIDEDYQETVETPDSTAFTQISYRPFGQELRVQFRKSDARYVYYDVQPETWYQFKNADSKGRFFNEFIKNKYEYARE